MRKQKSIFRIVINVAMDLTQNIRTVVQLSEVESSTTSLASKTHFEVLSLEGQVLGLEAYKSSKIPCPRTALFFD